MPQDYEIIELDENEQVRYELSDGEQFENKLIDQTADGSMFYIAMEDGADNWAIRNVGWKGVAPNGSGNRDGTFLINVRGNGTIENIFIDQRNHTGDGFGSDVGGIWTYSNHHGHIECKHNFIAGCGNNGCYDSGDGYVHVSSTGTVSHHRSYHRDNTPSNFRPGKPSLYMTECVSIANDPDGTRGNYPANNSQMCRLVWAWHHPDIYVEDSHFWADPNDVNISAPFWATHRGSDSEGDTCELNIVDCHINASWEEEGNSLVASGHGDSHPRYVHFTNLQYQPSIEVLGSGVPLTPEMAASGQRALPPEIGTSPSGGHGETDNEVTPAPDPDDESPTFRYEDDASGVHTELPYELVIQLVIPGERLHYEATFDSEDLEAGEFPFGPTVSGNVASGSMGPNRGLDNMYFDGHLVSIEGEELQRGRFIFADAQNREVIDELELPLKEPVPIVDTEPDDELNTISIEGLQDTLVYSFEVSGEITDYSTDGEASNWDHITVDEHVVFGVSTDQKHNFEFTGSVEQIAFYGRGVINK